MYRSYKVRLFPTPKQSKQLNDQLTGCRFVWNYLLELKESRYINSKKFLGKYEMINEITYLKKHYSWLKNVSISSMQQECIDLYGAYMFFFSGNVRHPQFKKKKSRKQSFPLSKDAGYVYFFDKKYAQIPKIGRILYKTNLNVPIGKNVKLINPRIRYVQSSKKWILTFSLECDSQASELSNDSMGIDLGVKKLAVVAIGDKQLVFGNINKSKRMKRLERKKKHILKSIVRKCLHNTELDTIAKGSEWKDSRQVDKYWQMYREICAKQTNIRQNYIHHITRQLVDMCPSRIVIEDLNVLGMLKNKYLSEAVNKQNFGEFRRQIIYKAEEKEIPVVLADRYFPSSKLCSCCGYKNKSLKLKDREWTCPNCGTHHDRDYNAAINLMNYTETQYNS